MSDNLFDEWLSGCDFQFWGTGQHKLDPAQFFELWAQGKAVLLDVRSNEERQQLGLQFALHIPVNELPKRWQEVPRDKVVATFCSGGDRSNVAYAYLQSKGVDNVRIFKGTYVELTGELMPGKLLKYLKSRA
jgi:rhodanese-related sulfurtransferase